MFTLPLSRGKQGGSFGRSRVLRSSETERINLKCLELRVTALSDELILKLVLKLESRNAWTFKLDSLLEGRSIDELMTLGNESLQRVFECSVLRMNKPIFDIALKCIEARGLAAEAMPELLDSTEVQEALMEADAVDLLKRMTADISLTEEVDLLECMLVCATMFRARRCVEYLQEFAENWRDIPDMVLAYAHIGDLERVEILCSGPDMKRFMDSGIEEAVIMGHLDVAKFMRDKFERELAAHEVKNFAHALLTTVKERANPCVINRLLSSVEFLAWVLKDLVYTTEIKEQQWLEYAIDGRHKELCHYLAGTGCNMLAYRGFYITFDKTNLLDFLDLCCGLDKDCPYGEAPEVELFLVKRGIQIPRDENPVARILWGGVKTASLSNRVELIKHYLMEDPLSGTKTRLCFLDLDTSLRSFHVTPLGYLELLDTPQTVPWTGKKVIKWADFVPSDSRAPKTDEWNVTRPNAKEIQAVGDIRAALIQHGADPEYLFAPDSLMRLDWFQSTVQPEFIRRLIHGRAEVNHKHKNGDTPLSLAMDAGQPVTIIKLMLELGASVDSIDEMNSIKNFVDRRDGGS